MRLFTRKFLNLSLLTLRGRLKVIISSAHKAAYPEKYPLRDEARELYPVLNGIGKRFVPTSVHLQVYDGACIFCFPILVKLLTFPPDAPHILPVLFSFTTPAKFCFRAIASFCKFVTDIQPPPPPNGRRRSSVSLSLPSRRPSFLVGLRSHSAKATKEGESPLSPTSPSPFTFSPTHSDTMDSQTGTTGRRASSIKRGLSYIARASPKKNIHPPMPMRLPPNDSILGEPIAAAPLAADGEAAATINTQPHPATSIASSDVGGPRFQTSVPSTSEQDAPIVRKAGEMSVYEDIKVTRL